MYKFQKKNREKELLQPSKQAKPFSSTEWVEKTGGEMRPDE